MSNNIKDIITKIRNAYIAKKKIVRIPYTKFSKDFVKILFKEGFIKNTRYHQENKKVFISLMLKEKKNIYLKNLSHSYKKIYVKKHNIPKILDGMGIIILSTSCGIMTDKDARLKKIGGEILLSLW
uniref:ribosomal protein S8 n=1 Tax=Hydnora esculenta TaxID=1851369 RepID=UPI002113BF5A|nr:ribosomal protein S8 [Hydnora esculenta]USN93642.1 ribosomal protein S8 [Hydnora esculenta]